MKVLIDECLPRMLTSLLNSVGHQCQTVQKAGWAGKKNGELLALAEGQFDALVTVDKGFAHQQRLKGRMIAVLVIHARSNDLDDVRRHVSATARALKTVRPGQVVHIGA